VALNRSLRLRPEAVSLSLSLSLSLSYMYIYEMAEKTPQQHFEGDSRMGAVITL